MNLGKFRDKRSVVTGGFGFIGSNLTEKLLHYGAKVLVIDDLNNGKRSAFILTLV